ncbi:MAG: hypothetical protein U5K38_08460 [Woeseiaceae bacterium]|nr:hypothetical protein [Woeseiaceae bacterium]
MLIPALLLGGLLAELAMAKTGFAWARRSATRRSIPISTDFDLDYDSDFGWSRSMPVSATDFFAIKATSFDFGDFSEWRNLTSTQTDVATNLTGFDVMAVLSIALAP